MRAVVVMMLVAVLCMPSLAAGASFEVGYSYAFDVLNRDPGRWVYIGSAVSCGIVGTPTEGLQIGAYTSYGRYHRTSYSVTCPADGWAFGCHRDGRTLGAVDLGVVFRAVPPSDTQVLREFLFISYAARIMNVQDWRDGFYDTAVLTVGFGGMIRLREDTRLIVQGGPAFARDQSDAWLPFSVAVQFGSP